MDLLLAVLAWAAIGAIAGFVAPIIAGTGRERMRRTIPLGAVAAVAAGLAAYVVNSLFDDDGDRSTFYGASGATVAVIVTIILVVLERKRDRP